MQRNTFPVDDVLYVVVVISNYKRFNRRYQLYKEFMNRLLLEPKVRAITVEIAFGNREFEVTNPESQYYPDANLAQYMLQPLQLRTRSEIWHKENMINLGVTRLPCDWQYMAWIDADIEFNNHNWVDDTLHALQHYDIVQMFQTATMMGPDTRTLTLHQGFAYSFLNGCKLGKQYTLWHPGFAWAATRCAWDAAGGLPDFCILGSADHSFACLLIGRLDFSLPRNISPRYWKRLEIIQEMCERKIQRNIGFVEGNVQHYWHGSVKNRRYRERWEILTDNHFDPDSDLVRDWQGLYSLAGNKPRLRADISKYFVQRNEDSIDE